MNTTDWVKKYKKELKEGSDKQKRFNVWAFLFGAIYFIFRESFGYFVLFMVLPFIASLPFVLFLRADIALCLGFLVAHTIAGFVAGPVSRKYKENYVEKYADVDTDKNVEYYAISLTRFAILMVLSGGLYVLYWGYRNWKSYQETTKDAVSPAGRALFIHLTAPFLAEKIIHTTKDSKWYLLSAWAFFVAVVAYRLIDMATRKGWFAPDMLELVDWCAFVLVMVSLFVLLPLQKAVNRYTLDKLKKSLQKSFYLGEIIIVVLGFVLNYTNLLRSPYQQAELPFAPEQAEKAGASIGFIYRHTEGYSTFCKKQGYVMKQYPNDFKVLFSKEIADLSEKLGEKGYTIEDFRSQFIPPQLAEYLESSIYREMEMLKRNEILSYVAEENGVPVEEVRWEDRYDSLLTFRDVCEYFDKNGIYMLKSGKGMNFLKENAL